MNRQSMVFGVVMGMAGLAACTEEAQGPPRNVSEVTGPTPVVGPTAPLFPPPFPPQAEDSALVGSYDMTLEIGPECAAVPEPERTRRYAATIDRRADGQLVVSLGDARFLTGPTCTSGSGHYAGMGCHQFFAADEGNTVRFSLVQYDDWHGGQIVEQLSSGTWLEVTGNAAGTFNRRRNSIEASGPGDAWYCPIPSGNPFPCSRPTGCATTLWLTLTRR
jgi:hypothetical protein